MTRPPRRRPLPAFALALLLSSVLAACGSAHSKVSTGTYAGESGKNAPYLDVGSLTYEVQLSRELNPYDPEDATYLQGLTPAEAELSPTQEWFAVFLQVYNNTSSAWPAATNLTIADTAANTYFPVVPNQTNQFAYRGGTVGPGERLPEPQSVAASGPTQGALVLYKIQRASLDNRPITLTIVDPTNPAKRAFGRARHRAQGSACNPASSTSRATGAAVAPPAPSLTSRTPTAIRG